MKYIRGLDTLRAFAVIFVIIYHWGLPLPANEIFHRIQRFIPDGRYGVDMFFVLSGFLITRILLAARSQADQPKISIIKNFIIRRALRIFPIYYAVILFLLIVGYPFVRENVGWFVSYASNILCYKNMDWNPFSHTWSLAVEEQFYLIWPWVILYTKEAYLKYVFPIAILIGIVFTVLTVKVWHNEFGMVLTPSCMQAFGIGGYYAYTLNLDQPQKLFLKALNIILPISVLAHFYWAFSPDGGHLNYWHRTANSVIAIWLIHQIISNKREWLRRSILENRVFNFVGKISYGIYLYHYPLPYFYAKLIGKLGNGFFEELLANFYFAYFAKLLLLLCVAASSYYFFEKPIMRLKSKFQY